MNIILLVFFILFTIVQTEQNLYSLLGVSQDATSQQIKKAFRKLSIKYHPDRNTQAQNAQAIYISIKRAYQVLIDVSKRNTYDLFGQEGLSQIQKRPKPKGGDYRPSMNVPLAKFYQGGQMVFSFRRGQICKKCKGTGDESGILKDCPICGGSGKMTRTVNVKGETKQMQMKCKQCHGAGKGAHNKCPVCRGQKIVMRPRDLKFDVQKGMVDGDKVMFKGQSQQGFQFYPGDVIITLKQQQNNLFKRDKNDLKIQIPISLKEAILGFERNIKHLDNRNIQIVGDYNIQDDQVIRLEQEGMPIRGEQSYGDLIATVKVKFPASYTSEQLQEIRAIFANKPSVSDL